SGTLYFHLDQLGSVRALTDSTGAVVATYSYDPYGKLTGSTGTADTALRWAGQYTDPESGLVYLRARYYDPATGQFITRDPLEERTQAPYSYVDDSPLNGLDLTGLCWGPDIRCKAQHLAGRVANDVYHPVRFALTSPLTAVTVSVDKLGYGADCDWNSKNWVVVCYGAPTVLNAPATTFGAAVNSKVSRDRFARMNCGRALAHETKHTDQWATLGPLRFGIEDGLGAAFSELFWRDNAHNPIEIEAGLEDGGYEPCC
ncbi:MAG TPA: RHS repeat-associated core domain-containing protein, partial [Jatrophihabitans sp.]